MLIVQTLPWLVLGTALVGCHQDATLTEKDEGGAFETGTPFRDSDSAPPAEECNGLDDDGDGQVDEGFPDADADGIADCVDPTCPPLTVGVAGTVPTVAACTAPQPVTPVDTPWATTVEWTWLGGASSEWGVTSGPVVAVTDDTDGDGVLSMADIPAVIVSTMEHTTLLGSIVALDGATGVERWRWTGGATSQQPAVADVNGDGIPEVLAFETDGSVVAIEPPGTLLWRSSEPVNAPYGFGLVTAADLEGDGTVEVLAENGVIEGATGVVRFLAPVDHVVAQLGGPSVADLDGDGTQEVLYYGSAYDASGALLWTTGEENFRGNWAVPVQADGDPEPEIVEIATNFGLYEPDGTVIHSGPYQRNSYAGAPCAGDFDGDGEVEVAFGSMSSFLVMSLDGAIEWQTEIDDSSCCGGCSGFDLDGDGGLEIAYNDQYTTYLFDAAAGAVLARFPRAAGTLYEYPVIADIDADGASELLVTSELNGKFPALTVLGHAGAGWPSLGTTWPIHDFAMSNIGVDASVPSHPEPYWSEYRIYRARVPVDVGVADLFVTVTDACVLDCVVGPAALALQVGNQGLADVPEGATLTLYAVDGGEAREIDRWTLPAIPSGATLAGIERAVLPEEIGVDGFRAVVTPPGGTEECDVANNTTEWTEVPC